MNSPKPVIWQRKGRIVKIPKQHQWWKSHAAPPTCLPLSGRCWRIWFAGRDAEGCASILSVDIDPVNDMKILSYNDSPILQRGVAGAFDSAGIWPCSALKVNDSIFLWYTGMKLGQTVPHQLAIGLAISSDGGKNFEKIKNEPILSAGSAESKFVTTPTVVKRSGQFEMWYSACPGWSSINGKLESFYDLHHACSSDGINWITSKKPVLSLDQVNWAGMVRPWLDFSGVPTVWFSARGSKDFRKSSEDAYHLYCAPIHGTAINPALIEPVLFTSTPKNNDWDSWMQAYCCIVKSGNKRVMFYCGNNFGRDGFGYAVESSPQ